MNDDLRQQATDYLQQHNVLTVATHGPAGVWAAAVFYVNDGFTFYFLSSPTSRHSQNMAVQPIVAGTVQSEYYDWADIKGVQLEGEVTRLKGEARMEAIRLYGEKFPIVAQLHQAPSAIVAAFSKAAWYRLNPSRLYFLDNSHGFGHRAEIELGNPAAAEEG